MLSSSMRDAAAGKVDRVSNVISFPRPLDRDDLWRMIKKSIAEGARLAGRNPAWSESVVERHRLEYDKFYEALEHALEFSYSQQIALPTEFADTVHSATQEVCDAYAKHIRHQMISYFVQRLVNQCAPVSKKKPRRSWVSIHTLRRAPGPTVDRRRRENSLHRLSAHADPCRADRLEGIPGEMWQNTATGRGEVTQVYFLKRWPCSILI